MKVSCDLLVLGLLLIGTTLWQGKRNGDEQVRMSKQAAAQQANSEAQYNKLQGKLDNITQFVAHPPASFTPADVTAAVRAMATNPVKSQPSPQPPIVTSAPYGNLAERCKELGTAIVEMADRRKKLRPNPAVDLQAYNEWYRQNDGLGFHGRFYRQATKIHKELADLHVDDPELDELLQQHEEYFRDRNQPQNIQNAIDPQACTIFALKISGE